MSIQLEFHVLESTQHAAWLHVCRLLAKFYQQNRQVYVYTQTDKEAEKLDALLWTFQDDAFIPHELFSKSTGLKIQLGEQAAPLSQDDVLINLNTALPPFYTQFKQVVEIVFSDPNVQQLARERYKQYRDHGLDITTHKIKANHLS